MIKTLYGVQETCPLFDGGKHRIIKYPLVTTREQAEQYKEDLEIIDEERVTCCEYEIVALQRVSDNYKDDLFEIHKRHGDMDILEEVKGTEYVYGRDNNMNLLKACELAREGNFVSHRNFTTEQSMHEYKGNFYYEDGANLTASGFIDTLKREEWAKDGWYIKYHKEQIDKEKLEKLHKNNKHYMFINGESYEDCIIV